MTIYKKKYFSNPEVETNSCIFSLSLENPSNCRTSKFFFTALDGTIGCSFFRCAANLLPMEAVFLCGAVLTTGEPLYPRESLRLLEEVTLRNTRQDRTLYFPRSSESGGSHITNLIF